MLKIIGWIIKSALFAVLVLVLGNWIHWGDKTVSDQIKTKMGSTLSYLKMEKSSAPARHSVKPKKFDRDIPVSEDSTSEAIQNEDRQQLKRLLGNQ